ncbi:hypothetical protein NQ314_020753 [Rhamnusium bicolor]|uniref:HMG box domain-containing protein n=1 Tax=Rhamnusium bicolor TaxID=1586634 RepID=A0AAV8WL05_9CUCU|nr:hypothetical protein NQ314_020753 [Rhamnusium bicolor]
MNSKRNKKNIADNASPSNNNYKTKSKNIINAEAVIIKTQNTVKKQRKKENVNLTSNENNKIGCVKVGRKRKHHDPDVEIPPQKKAKKKVKEQTDLNNANVQEVVSIPSAPNSSFDSLKVEPNETVTPKRSKKKSKSGIAISDQQLYLTPDQSNGTLNAVETPSQKNNKKKSKFNQNALETTIPSFHSVNSVNCKAEIPPINYSNEIHLQDDLNDIKEDFLTVKDELLRDSDSVHITVKDLDTDSDLTETELFKEQDKKVEKKVENPDDLLILAVKNNKAITWPEEDLKILVDRMEKCIPDNDVLAFSTRAEKLEWDVVAFKNYTVEECKNTWLLLQKQIRKFRLLKEVIADAKEWINLPKNQKKKATRHPDMPRKPLTAYFIYYLKKKDIFHKAHPGLDAAEISKVLGQEFKSLAPQRRLKYEHLAAKKKKGKPPKPPKLPKPVKEKPPPKPPKERIPKRPPPPFQYFYLSELKTQPQTGEEANKLAFKELCKERWKQLADKNKLIWINCAEMEYAKYEEELKTYVQNHPDYVHNPHKPILTKEEIQIKERVAGKPSKPPSSAYNLFARMLLQSDEIKSIPVRDRLNFVSNQWKNCAEEEKKQYRDLSMKLNEKYKLDFESYLKTLPEEERKLELQKSLPKRRKSEDVEKKKKTTKKKKSQRKIVVKKIVEPEQPPISAFKYFATLYTGEEPAAQAWKALSSEQKRIYEDELVKKKQAYIVDFEKFLKSLTKEELEAFSNSRRKIKQEPEGEEEAEDDEEESSNESGTEESDADSNDSEEDSKI